MFGIPWPLIKWGGIAVAIVVAAGWLYLEGRSAGRESVLAKLRDDKIQILKDGKEIDDAVDLSDDSALCALLGGCDADGVRNGADGDKPL